jgi:hypothetical protein
MPWGLKRYYGTGSLHFIPWSCYRRKPLLGQPNAPRPATYCPRTDAHSLPFCRDWIRGHARTRASADFRTFNWRSLEDNSGIRRSGIGSDQRLDLVGGENSTERWLSVGRVSAKIPTSRKEREKWGTRREMGHPAFPFYFALCRDAFGFSAKQLCPWRMLCAAQTSNSR